MKTILSLSIALFLIVLTGRASAQEVTRLPEGTRQFVGLDAGLDSAVITRASYGHRVDLGFAPEARLVVRFTLPVASPDLGDWAVDGGVQATAWSWHDLRLAVLVGPVMKHTENEVYAATAFGLSATALFGFESNRWGASAELGYEQLLTTYLKHSSLYRDTFYDGAKNGFYALSGSTAHAGLRGGARIGALELAARAGLDATGQLHATQPPFYFTLGSGYAF